MKKYLLLIPFIAGCAHYSTQQLDSSYDSTGKKTREISTEVSVTTFFDSQSEITKSKVIQTDKSQSSSVGTVAQEASGTNVIGLINAVSAGATKGALEYMVPK